MQQGGNASPDALILLICAVYTSTENRNLLPAVKGCKKNKKTKNYKRASEQEVA